MNHSADKHAVDKMEDRKYVKEEQCMWSCGGTDGPK